MTISPPLNLWVGRRINRTLIYRRTVTDIAIFHNDDVHPQLWYNCVDFAGLLLPIHFFDIHVSCLWIKARLKSSVLYLYFLYVASTVYYGTCGLWKQQLLKPILQIRISLSHLLLNTKIFQMLHLNIAHVLWQTKSRPPDKCYWFFFLNQNICCGCSKEPSQWRKRGSSVVRHLPLVLEVPGSIQARGKENFGVWTLFL